MDIPLQHDLFVFISDYIRTSDTHVIPSGRLEIRTRDSLRGQGLIETLQP